MDRAGVKTSEFYRTLLAEVTGLLVLMGVIPMEDAEHLVELAVRILGGLVSIIALFTYVRGRVELKKEVIRSQGMQGLLAKPVEESVKSEIEKDLEKELVG